MHSDAAEALALKGLTWLAEDGANLGRFLGETGLGPADLRRRIEEPAFLAAVLDFILGSERLAVAFAESAGLKPEDLRRARMALPASSPDSWG